MNPKRKLEFFFFTSLFTIFLVLRIINLEATYLWLDDVLSGGYLRKIPWNKVLPHLFNEIRWNTHPILPILTLNVVSNIFGPNIIAFRLPALIVSSVSFCLLYLVLKQLVSDIYSRYLPLAVFTFSIPSILYGQAMQPSIYYFFSGILQLYVFIILIKKLQRGLISNINLCISICFFGILAFAMFFFNYMSIFNSIILGGAYFLFLILKLYEKEAISLKKTLLIIITSIMSFMPLLLITYWRLNIATQQKIERPYFKGIYYLKDGSHILKSIQETLSLFYDFLSYHFNFAYTPSLYVQKGSNLLSIPFVIVAIMGIVYFVWKRRFNLLALLYGCSVFLTLFCLKLTPFGGIRHSFTIAPYIYVFFGYGIEAIRKLLDHYNARASIFKGVSIGFAMIIIIIFLCSGINFYDVRRSLLDIPYLVQLAKDNKVNKIAGWADTWKILYIMNYSQGNVSEKNGIRWIRYSGKLNDRPDDYLLVGGRYAMEVGWNVPWYENIAPAKFKKAKEVIALHEDIGPLDPKTMGIQSIYYPVNGCFVYLVKTHDNGALKPAGKKVEKKKQGLFRGLFRKPIVGKQEGEIIADNESSQFEAISGIWSRAKTNACFGTDFHWARDFGDPAEARWTIEVPKSGGYEVFARWTQDRHRATNTPYKVHHAGGVDTVKVNQQKNGGEWVSLGTYSFSKDSPAVITITNDANGYVIADAVKLEYRKKFAP